MFIDYDFAGYTSIVTGWGRKKFDQPYGDRFLHKVKLSVLSGRECSTKKVNKVYTQYSYQMLCAYGHGVDACMVNLIYYFLNILFKKIKIWYLRMLSLIPFTELRIL